MRLTIAVPSAHIDIANHYAMALGYSEADGETYRNPSWEDADGNLYAVAPQANPSQIVATLGMSGQEAISVMGLTPVPQDDLI